MKTKNKIELDSDENVQKMIETWDIVKCAYCKKEISMLTAKLIRIGNQEYFVCRKGHR